ncbi:MAG TPA: TlpA disulfide reductase family protein, partial [Puia sp.]|nr:TlpA disulfide reductase family protein [Puia sp.]
MKSSLIILSVCYVLTSMAQIPEGSKSKFPEIGKHCPDFILNNIDHFSRKSASLRDFQGKWLILDLWIKNCFGCIASFPGTDSLQKRFKDKVQFMLVGITSLKNLRTTRAVYERSRSLYHLDLPVTYDSTLAARFRAPSYPHIIWIDDNGIVRAITGSVHEKSLEKFLAGGNPDTGTKPNDDEVMNNPNRFDPRKPFLIHGNGGNDTDFYIRS